MNRANWDLWAKMKKVYLWQAIALLHDLEPESDLIKVGFLADGPDRKYFVSEFVEGFLDPKLQATHKIMMSWEGLPESFELYEKPNSYAPLEYTVDLPSVGSWAKICGLEIPDRFPAQHAREPSNPSAGAPGIRISHDEIFVTMPSKYEVTERH